MQEQSASPNRSSSSNISTSTDASQSADKSRIDSQLLATFEEIHRRIQQGEAVDIDEYVQRLPQHADTLRQIFGTMQVMGDLCGEASSIAGSGEGKHAEAGTACDSASEVYPRRLGEFTILRQVGRGGMGVVYEAYQGTLERRVALKVLPLAGIADERQIKRFKNEARAAATLHHTNIVPIYSVGSDRGVHYYAMQFVDAPNLTEIIRELSADRVERVATNAVTGSFSPASSLENPQHISSADCDESTSPPADTHREIQAGIDTIRSNAPREYFRTVAKWIAAAADGLAHAHENGIIHRDIKPSNLMVDKTGHVWITDFGLARLETDASLTATGDLLGTLRYMAPEQVSSDRTLIDHRADIYALGLTMYELLTLKPAFGGNNRSALLKRISHAVPTAPRALDNRIPRELETIVLKAIEKSPHDRYRSAAEMAEDLQLYLANRPIKAKRPSLAMRTLTWSARHRGLVASLGAGFLLALTISLVVVSGANRQIRSSANALQVKNDELMEANARASKTLSLARSAIDDVYVEYANDWLGQQPSLSAMQREFLVSAAEIYTQLLVEFPKDPDLKLRTIESQIGAANISGEMGSPQDANTWFQRTFDLLANEQLPTQEKGKLLSLEVRALTDYLHFNSFHWNQKFDLYPRENFHMKMMSALEQLDRYTRQHPLDIDMIRSLVHAQAELLRYDWADLDELDLARQVIENSRTLFRLDQSAESQVQVSATLEMAVRRMLRERKPSSGSVNDVLDVDLSGYSEEVIEAAQVAYKLSPTHQNQRQLALSFGLQADVRTALGLLPEAIDSYGLALEQQIELAQDFPHQTDYWDGLCGQYLMVRGLYLKMLRSDNTAWQEYAASHFEERFQAALKLDFPKTFDSRACIFRSNILSHLAVLYGFQKDAEKSFQCIQEAFRARTEAGDAAGSLRERYVDLVAADAFQLAPLAMFPFSFEQRKQMLAGAVAIREHIATGNTFRADWGYEVWSYHPDQEIADAAAHRLFEWLRREPIDTDRFARFGPVIALMSPDRSLCEDAIAECVESLNKKALSDEKRATLQWVLGWAYYQTGDFHKALHWFNEFEKTERFSKTEAAKFQMSLILAELNQHEKAREYFEEGLTQIAREEVILSRGDVGMMLQASALFDAQSRTLAILESLWGGSFEEFDSSRR